MNDVGVKGKICCVTGAGRGIGHQLALALRNNGAIVVGVDMAFSEGSDLLDHELCCDLIDDSNIDRIFDFIEKNYGHLDVLVNCAGITMPSKEPYPMEYWKKTFLINVDVPFALTTRLVPLMKESNSPAVINITSLNAALAFPNNPAYVASKSALAGLTRSMALDLGSKGIRVNSIAPGYIKTKMTGESWTNLEKRAARANRTVLNRWGTPDDLVGPLLFLASDSSAYVTGHALFVDGGWAIKGL
jgi:NAD(P)-dependent dehydrogenase (short-subunit alcohol dehydrogenase family)